MALFKVFEGTEEELSQVSYHEGYGYFIPGDYNFVDGDGVAHFGGKLFFDIRGERYQVDAASAIGLIDEEGKLITADQFLQIADVVDVEHGGTGRNSLTAGALLVGDGTNPIKFLNVADASIVIGTASGLGTYAPSNNAVQIGDTTSGFKGVTIPNNAIVLGDVTNGLKYAEVAAGSIVIGNATQGVAELRGVGAVYSLSEGAPQVGLLPVSMGGTNAATAAQARSNLSVYSREEIDTAIDNATTIAYSTTLLANDWVADNGAFTIAVNEDRLKCGKNGNVPPLVTYTSNYDDYSKIDEGLATAGEGIVFRASERPTQDIGIIIIDNK